MPGLIIVIFLWMQIDEKQGKKRARTQKMVKCIHYILYFISESEEREEANSFFHSKQPRLQISNKITSWVTCDVHVEKLRHW